MGGVGKWLSSGSRITDEGSNPSLPVTCCVILDKLHILQVLVFSSVKWR